MQISNSGHVRDIWGYKQIIAWSQVISHTWYNSEHVCKATLIESIRPSQEHQAVSLVWVCQKDSWGKDKAFPRFSTMHNDNPWQLLHCTIHQYLNNLIAVKAMRCSVFSIETSEIVLEYGIVKMLIGMLLKTVAITVMMQFNTSHVYLVPSPSVAWQYLPVQGENVFQLFMTSTEVGNDSSCYFP